MDQEVGLTVLVLYIDESFSRIHHEKDVDQRQSDRELTKQCQEPMDDESNGF